MILQTLEKNYADMSPGQRRIADVITSNLGEAVYMNAKQLSQRACISESAVVRFAAFLGYEGYRDMQRDMQREVESSKSILELFSSALEQDDHGDSDAKRVYNQALKNLSETVTGLPEQTYDEAVALIRSARNIGIAATRVAIAPALTLQILLNQLVPGCQLLTPGMDTSFDQINHWGPQDLLIGFSFMKAKNFTFDLLEFARAKGCKIISICDSYRNSIAGVSDLVFPVRSQATFLSFVPTMYVIDTLLYKLSLQFDEAGTKSLEEINEIITRYVNHL